MILQWWAYESVAIVVAGAIVVTVVALVRSELRTRSALDDRLMLLAVVLGVAAAGLYFGALLRSGMAVFSVMAIVEAKAYPPRCESSPFENCYRLVYSSRIILLSFGWPVPVAGLLGSALAWVFEHPILRAIGIALGIAALWLAVWALESVGDFIWQGPPMLAE